jgi:ADP-heptose:LPS heptosyltransferase
VEGLADRFEPALCGIYARLFAQAIAHVIPELDSGALAAHYERARWTRPFLGRPARIFVLSRVTLGADVAVTSVLLDAAKRRFPDVSVIFVGPAKNFELFAADHRLAHVPVEYRRGSLADRLAVLPELSDVLSDPQSLVIDPDSRLTQLGLLPVCPEERYHLFESRAYGSETPDPLPVLAARWAAETLGIDDAKPYIAAGSRRSSGKYIAVSLGVGENLSKRIPDPFEEDLLRLLGATGATLRIDRGAGGAEAERVTRAVERSGVPAKFWEGSFSGFARVIRDSSLYVGYDSAGQHVAAACRVPLLSIFAGFPIPRMFDRWRPAGRQSTVIRVDEPNPAETLERVRAALPALLRAPRSRP